MHAASLAADGTKNATAPKGSPATSSACATSVPAAPLAIVTSRTSGSVVSSACTIASALIGSSASSPVACTKSCSERDSS